MHSEGACKKQHRYKLCCTLPDVKQTAITRTSKGPAVLLSIIHRYMPKSFRSHVLQNIQRFWVVDIAVRTPCGNPWKKYAQQVYINLHYPETFDEQLWYCRRKDVILKPGVRQHSVFLDKSNNQHWPGETFFHNSLFGAKSYAATSCLSPTASACLYRGLPDIAQEPRTARLMRSSR